MKNSIFFIVLILLSLNFISCQKETVGCNDVEYATSFKIKQGYKYCFADGNYFIVEEMRNEFCPCNGECVWEGEMILKYETMVNTQIISKTVGSSNNTDSVFISNQYFIKFIDVKLVDPCSNSNPSPEIESATVVVRKE